ncbi:MAG: hypothetical protein KA214_04625 [Neisseriaceae bacterium]|nr:hypothetical protein [Neisseriaceae bacterium]
MLLALLFDVPLAALVVKILATAFVVISVSWAVSVLGPTIGGTLAGLPIVLGPGFYFMSRHATPAFMAEAAAYALLSLCATQLFLLAYLSSAHKRQPRTALFFALTAWLVAVGLLHPLPARPLIGALLFLCLTALCLRLGRARLMPMPAIKRTRALPLRSLMLRGLLAGLLVAVITTATQWLGATASGLLLAFPIGYTVVAVTLHQKLGAASAVATLYAALFGTASLAGFCTVLSLSLPYYAPSSALAMALASSGAITLGLMRIRTHQAKAHAAARA